MGETKVDDFDENESRQLTMEEVSKSIKTPDTQPKMTKNQILKNLIVLSVSYLFLFTAFQSLQNLQSSLNKEEGLGTASLSVIYGSGVVAGLLLPPFIINLLGCKWTLAVSMVCYIVFMAANMYAVWPTMMPASVIIGIGAAPLWAAKCTYLTRIGVWYAKITGATKDARVNLFFGIFFMTFQTSQVWGNLISSLLFKRQPGNTTDDVIKECGANYCPSSYINNTNLDRPSSTKVYTLCGIYLGSACLAVALIVIFLDKLELDTVNGDSTEGRKEKGDTSIHLLMSIVKHFWKSKYLKLLAPLTIYSGVEQAFVAGEFTRSYISCSVGIWNVGLVMIAYGAVDAACSLLFGRLVKFVGHIPFFSLAFILHGGTQITLLLWLPSPGDIHLLYILAALWGMGDAVVQTQINDLKTANVGFAAAIGCDALLLNYEMLFADVHMQTMLNLQRAIFALYGYLFTNQSETAFAIYRIFESLGFIIAFGYSNYLCTSVKIYFTLCFLIVGMLLYGMVELLHRRGHQDSKIQTVFLRGIDRVTGKET